MTILASMRYHLLFLHYFARKPALIGLCRRHIFCRWTDTAYMLENVIPSRTIVYNTYPGRTGYNPAYTGKQRKFLIWLNIRI